MFVNNLEANDTGFNSWLSCCCWSKTPSCYLLASHKLRNFLSIYRFKCVISVILSISWSTFKNVSSWSFVYSHSASIFEIDLNGAQVLAKLGTNLFNWLTAPKNYLRSLKLFGPSLWLIPFALLYTRVMTSPVNSYPSIWFLFTHAISYLSALKRKLALSNTSNTSHTFCICTLFWPFVTIKISSIYTNVQSVFTRVKSITISNSVGNIASP